MGTREKFTFFYRTASPFSQFHPSPFSSTPMTFEKINVKVSTAAAAADNADASSTPNPDVGVAVDHNFLHCEMWMMFHKARLFRDEATAAKILATPEPAKCKALGRKVHHFDQTLWTEVNRSIIYEGNRHKFTQNPALLRKLRATRGTTLVEASPSDRIYGIGLTEDDPRARDRSTWRGQNLLGQVLTELRDELDNNVDVDVNVNVNVNN